MRNHLAITGLLLAGMALAAIAWAAEPVYKWIDSAGHSHYSQTPPEGQKYQTITPVGTVSDTTTPPPATDTTTTATPPPASNPTPAQVERQKRCDTARNNVQILTNQPVVNMDVYNTGKAQRLTPAQQTEQLNKAQQQVQALCGQ